MFANAFQKNAARRGLEVGVFPRGGEARLLSFLKLSIIYRILRKKETEIFPQCLEMAESGGKTPPAGLEGGREGPAGLSDQSAQRLAEADQTAVIKELIEAFRKPAGELYIDQAICRYLLVKGDAVGGTMRNRIGALGQETPARAILSCLDARGIAYDWMANQTRALENCRQGAGADPRRICRCGPCGTHLLCGRGHRSGNGRKIYAQLEDGSLSNAANLTDASQMTAYCNWLIGL